MLTSADRKSPPPFPGLIGADQATIKTNRGYRTRVSSYETKCRLIASDELPPPFGYLTISGYIPLTGLGSNAKWKALSVSERTQRVQGLLERHGDQLQQALSDTIASAANYLEVCEKEGLTPKIQKLKDQWASGRFDLSRIRLGLTESLTAMRAKVRHAEIAAQIGEAIKLSEYPDTFAARSRNRKLIAVLGPTNSGKTYDAFKRLSTARSGVYLGPLRLLALEAFGRLNAEFDTPTSLITGEERREISNARVTASTIEMLDTQSPVDVAVIDEIQMLNDPDRGWAWTQAVVGANASEVWLLGALSAESAIKSLAARLGLPLEIRYKERKHPLEIGEALASKPAAAIRQARPGDALIVFSRRDALNLRDDLLALGKSVACIYGALSPEVRENEALRFSSGQADLLVATDAIGMGLNLPIERIVFTSVRKYDGVARDELPIALTQQIGGRAGRYGHQADAGIVAGLTPAEHAVVTRLMSETQVPLRSRGFQIAASTEYLEEIARLTKETKLEALLVCFMTLTSRGDEFFKPYVPSEQLTRAEELDRMERLDLATKHLFSLAPMAIQHEAINDMWRTWALAVNEGNNIDLGFVPNQPQRATLEEAETIVRLLAAYRWFGYRAPDIFVDYEHAPDLLEIWTAVVDSHLRSQARQGVGGGRLDTPSWYWRS